MANEELHQRGYLDTGKLLGSKFGDFEELNIGATSVQELKKSGVDIVIPDTISFPFSVYKPPKNPGSCRPDRVFLRRTGTLEPVAVAEHKAPTKLRAGPQQVGAAEQGLFSAASIGARVAVTSNGQRFYYIDVDKSLQQGELVFFDEKRDFVPAVLKTRADFIDEVAAELSEIRKELEVSAAEIASLKGAATKLLSLGDGGAFTVASGTRITGAQLRGHPGDLPIFSCFKNDRIIKGHVDRAFWQELGGEIETAPFVTVNANGASIGRVYVRTCECGITDDVISVQPLLPGISVDYLAIALQDAVNAGRFIYEAKLFVGRVKELEVAIPVDAAGNFSVDHQELVAAAVKRFNNLKSRLADLGLRAEQARTV